MIEEKCSEVEVEDDGIIAASNIVHIPKRPSVASSGNLSSRGMRLSRYHL